MSVDPRPTLPLEEISRLFKTLRAEYGRAHEFLRIPEVPRPEGVEERGPRIPANATCLHPADLGNLLVEFQAWGEYIEERLVDEGAILDALKSEKDSLFGALVSDPTILPASERSKIVKASSAYISIESKVLIQKHRVGLVKKEARRTSRDYAALSRIIELRLGGIQRGKGPEGFGEDDEEEE